MDPNVTLREMLALVATILHDYEDEDGNGVDQDDACSLASYVDAMNAWMTQNGFPPEAWKTPPVYICTYHHKHGTDVAAYRTEEAAIRGANSLALERVEDSWDDEDREKFLSIVDPKESLAFFHKVEMDVAYGETLEITESPIYG